MLIFLLKILQGIEEGGGKGKKIKHRAVDRVIGSGVSFFSSSFFPFFFHFFILPSSSWTAFLKKKV